MIMNLAGNEGIVDCEQLKMVPSQLPVHTQFQSALIREIINLLKLELSNDEISSLIQQPPIEIFQMAGDTIKFRANQEAIQARLNDPAVIAEAERAARASPFFVPTDTPFKPH